MMEGRCGLFQKMFSNVFLDLPGPAWERMKEEHMLVMGAVLRASIIEWLILSSPPLSCPQGCRTQSIGATAEDSIGAAVCVFHLPPAPYAPALYLSGHPSDRLMSCYHPWVVCVHVARQ